MMAQVLWSTQIYFSVAEQHRKLGFHLHDGEGSRRLARLELHQHIYVTVRTEVFPQYGAKKGQALDVMLLAEIRQLAVGT